MDSQTLHRALVRIAHEILERNHGGTDLVLIGIRTGGAHLASRLARQLQAIERLAVPVGTLDITLYRDDIGIRLDRPVVRKTEIPFSIAGKCVVLVDDVLYTGRTIRAAMDNLMDLGRPKMIQLAVLIDRGHRELPLRADYVGKNLPTAHEEEVRVCLEEEGEDDRVALVRQAGGT